MFTIFIGLCTQTIDSLLKFYSLNVFFKLFLAVNINRSVVFSPREGDKVLHHSVVEFGLKKYTFQI